MGMAAVSLVSQVSGMFGQKAQAKQQNEYATRVYQQQEDYRRSVMGFQNKTWEQDLNYAQEVLSYSKTEFQKQLDWADTAVAAVERNRNADTFTLAARAVEETIAATFSSISTRREGQAGRASFAAKDRGVEGNSVGAVLNDVMRQEGEAQTVVAMNRDATLRQLTREAMAVDAGADRQMSEIASSIKTFSPQSPIRGPAPVQPTAPPQTVREPGAGQLALGVSGALFGSAMSGIDTYGKLSGQTMKQTTDQLTSWAGRQFKL